MGRRTHNYEFDVLLNWAFENTTVHTYVSSGVSKDIQSYTLFAERPNTQQMPYSDGLSLCKHNQYNVYFPPFSALLRTVFSAQFLRTHSKSLIVHASLWSPNFVRLHSRLRRDIRIYWTSIYIYIYISIYIYVYRERDIHITSMFMYM